MWIYDKKKKVEKNVKTYMDMEKFPEIKGYDFSKKFDSDKFFKSFINMGFQGSNLGLAINLFKEMIKEKKKGRSELFLSFTGNMISSGNRELITFLVKEKLIDGIVTSAAGIEEDIIKSIKSFHLGSFDVKGKMLFDECVGRIGNIFVPADRYLYLERFLQDLFKEIYKIQKKEDKIFSGHEVIRKISELIEIHKLTKDKKDESFLYWCYKNNIPVFSPTLNDGAIGDISVFFKQKNPDFVIDITKDNHELTRLMMNSEKTSCVVLGGGASKHFLLNAAIFRDGFEKSIYINTAHGFDGSDSGGNQEEAISWAKIKPDAERVKVVCDATIGFPILMAGCLS